jgi:hypothetical protein
MNIDKDTRSNQYRLANVGLQQEYPPTATIVLAGVSFAPADIAKAFQAVVDAADATTAATAMFHKAVADEQAAIATAGPMYRALKAYILNAHKASPDVLAAFGFTLPSRQVPSAATVSDAVTKRAATRKARHTMGPRQKAGIKGTVTTAPATPAGSPTTPETPVPVVTAPRPAS